MVGFILRFLSAGFVFALITWQIVDDAHAKGTLTTIYQYYPVTGSSARSLHSHMTVPVGFFSSEKSYANITMKSSFKGNFAQGKVCRIKGFGINAKFIVRLPKLRNGTRLTGRTKGQFRSFVSYVRKHELKHRSIWTRCLRSAERRIKALRIKSCKKLDSVAAGIIRNEWAKCEIRNANFDKLEAKRLLRLPLVKAALKPARPVRAAGRSTTRTNSALARPSYRRALGKANQ